MKLTWFEGIFEELTKSVQNTVLRLPDKTDEVSSKHRFEVAG
ncbi:hypothetical protein [Streptococcus pneumoniae]|nr:hypothetical protein [Streptococcus pneumoniae]